MSAAICAVVKNEGRYLREWIGHHVAVGFRHLYMFDNESTDDTAYILKQAAAYGVASIQRIESNPEQNTQLFAYEFGHKMCIEDYILFIDADELLNLKVHDSIDDFLSEQTSDAIGINWRLFGDGGATHYGPGLMSERFKMAAVESFIGNFQVKTIARTSAIKVPAVHTHYLLEGATFTNSSGQQLKHAPACLQNYVDFSLVQLNHYFSKTFEEWEIKKNRGRVTLPFGHPDRVRSDDDWHFHNTNDIADQSIRRWSNETKIVMKSIFGV